MYSPPKKGKVEWKVFVELARQAGNHAAKQDVILTVHHHVGTMVETLDEILTMVRQIGSDSLGICFDCAHFLLCNDDLKQGIEKMSKWIKYVHLKDLVRNRADVDIKLNLGNVGKEFIDLGEGILDFRSITRNLHKIGYDGWLTVEIENRRYGREDHARKNLEYIKALIGGA